MRILHVLGPVLLTACGPRVIDLSASGRASTYEVAVDEVFIVDCGTPNDQDPEVHSAHWRIPEYRDADGGFIQYEESIIKFEPDVIAPDDEYRFAFRGVEPGQGGISIPATENASNVVQDTCSAQFIVE